MYQDLLRTWPCIWIHPWQWRGRSMQYPCSIQCLLVAYSPYCPYQAVYYDRCLQDIGTCLGNIWTGLWQCSPTRPPKYSKVNKSNNDNDLQKDWEKIEKWSMLLNFDKWKCLHLENINAILTYRLGNIDLKRKWSGINIKYIIYRRLSNVGLRH